MKNKWILILIILFGVVLGFLIGRYLPVAKMTETSKSATKKEKKVKYWVAPMNPTYRRDKPGKSPMGMDLVPVYEDEGSGSDDSSIKISPRVINNLGVITASAKYEPISKAIDTVGYVAANEDDIENVNSFIDGWVRNLRITAVGDPVRKGQVLFELYSPSLVNAQQELVLALQNNNQQLVEASRKKLITLGLTSSQINELQRTRKVKQQIEVYAKSSGIISKLSIRDGIYIKPDKILMTIEDLSSVWIRVEVYEAQSDWVKLNQIAQATFPGLPGKVWQGEVIYIYPTLDKITHTLAVRLQFPNPNLTLKPDMYASVKILIPTSKKSLVIPTFSVITTGKGSHVILSLGKGRFRPQEVILGDESNGKIEVLRGLSKGDEVVTSGQFLIDSESNLSAAFERLAPHKDKQMSGHHHGKHKMEKPKKSKNHGYILAIKKDSHKITIRHLPIKQYGMPEMVMELPVSSKIDLSPFIVGQKITFKLKEVKPNHYIVTELNPIKKDKGTD